MHARVARYRIDPDRCSDAATAFGTAGNEIAELDGFRMGHVLIDSENGEVLTVTLWESRAALDASEVRATSARQRAMREVEGEVESVTRYDVTIDLTR